MKGLISESVNALKGQTNVPGDKSISHRALMIGGVAIGPTTIRGLLMGDDVLRTARALEEMGVKIDRVSDDLWTVYGVGVGCLAPSARTSLDKDEIEESMVG